MKKRIISLLLVAVMLASMIPTSIIPVFAEPSSDRVMKKVDSATLDGKNTNGEYDNATKVMLNAYGNDTDGDNMRIVYTDEAVYVLIEVFDDTLVRYGTFLDDGTTKAGSSKCDFIFLGFSVGGSFQGMKRVYRDVNGAGRSVFQPEGTYVNMTDGTGGTLETKYFGYTEDENGFRLEARFPVNEMSAEDKALYKSGNLEVRFTAGTQDSENKGTEFALSYDGDIENRGWDGAATEDYFEYGSYKAKNPSNYSKYAFEVKTNLVAYSANATLDGKNTNGEYDDAQSIPLDKGTWVSPVAGDELRVIYSDDAIYALVEVTRDMSKKDSIHVYYQIGTSYVGYKGVASNGSGGNLTAYKVNNQGGTVDMTNGAGGYAAPAEYFAMHETANGFSFEVKFPVSKMNDTDKAAFKDGTLSVKLGASSSIGGLTAGASNTVAGLWRYMVYSESKTVADYELTSLELADKGYEQIPYISDAPTLDGKMDEGEYKDALVVSFEHAGLSWWAKAPDDNDVAYIVYAKDAIYVYVNGDASGSTSWDMTGMGFEIGTSYKGSVAGQGTNPTTGVNNINYLYSLGEKTVEKSFFVASADGKMSLEARFPVANMTEADQAAYKDGTLSVKFNFMNMDGYSATASFAIGAYAAFTTQANAEAYVLPYLTEFVLGERVETIPHTPFAPTLDGRNTNGEYDNAFVLPLENSGSGWWSRTPTAEDVAYVTYSNDAIYAFVEKNVGTSNGAWDQIGIAYKVGSSYAGTKLAQATGANDGMVTNFDGAAVQIGGKAEGYIYDSQYFGYYYDASTGILALEVRLPVANMTDADQKAFKDGTLEVGFAFMNMDNYTAVASFPIGSYSAFTSKANAEQYVLPYLTSFKLGEMTEIKNFIPHTTTAPFFDGLNTNGEYDDAFVLPLSYTGTGWWGRTPTDADVAYVMYTDNAIYVYIKGNKGTTNEAYDMTGVAFKIGSSYVGSKIVQNDYFASTLVSIGDVKMTNDGSYFAYQYDQAEGVLALEAKFPVANMTEADKEAFKNGRLSIALGAISMDNYVTVSSFPIATYGAFLNQANVEQYVLPNLSLFALGERTTEGVVNYVPYAKDGIKMDGKMTDGEYDEAFVLPLSFAGLSWWTRTPTDNDVAYVTYTQEAIYVFIRGNKGTTDEAYDMTGIGFKIGESFVGTKIVQNNYFNSTLISLGKTEVTNDNTFFRYYYSKEKGILDLEVKFPVELMTDADKEAFKNGTLSIELGAMNMDNYTTVASFPIQSYSAFLSKENAEKYVLPYLTSFTLKPGVSNGSTINEAVGIKDKIDLKHNVSLNLPSYEGAMMKYTIGNNAPVFVEGVLVDEVAKEYTFTYSVPYTAMRETVVVELVDREYVVLEEVDSYVIVDYCQKLLEQTAEELGITENQYQSMKYLVKAVLDLGAASDAMIGNTNNPVNEGVEVVLPDYSYTTKDVVIDKHTTLYDIEVLGIGVYYDADINTLNKMFIKIKTASPDNVRISFATGRILYLTNLTLVPVAGEADTYMAVTPVIDAEDFNKDFVMNVSYDEGNHVINSVYKITGNINAGLVELMEDADYGALALATYNYGIAVKLFLAA